MTHTPAGRSGTASNEANDGLGIRPRLVVLLEVFRCLLFHRTANLANENNTYTVTKLSKLLKDGLILLTLSLRLFKEDLDDVNVLSSGEGVSSNTNAKGLAESNFGCLRNGLVRQSPGA